MKKGGQGGTGKGTKEGTGRGGVGGNGGREGEWGNRQGGGRKRGKKKMGPECWAAVGVIQLLLVWRNSFMA